MKTAATLAFRELRGGIAGFRVFLLCLALGVAAIAAVGSTRAAIEAGLAAEGAALLGGDGEAEFTYRRASNEERAWLEAQSLSVSEVLDFRSMAVVDTGADEDRALTQVKAVDTAYPLVGSVALEPTIPLSQALADRGAVMQRVLADRLGLAIGDAFRLGDATLTLRAYLTAEPDAAAAGFSLGPRTIVLQEALDGSGLLQPGTLFSSKYRLLLPEGTDLAALQTEAKARFSSTGLRWRDARDGAPGISAFVDRLGAFLVLVGLSGLAVGGVGVSAAVRAYLAGKVRVIATLRTLGADRRTLFWTYFLQIAVLGGVGILIGVALGAALPVLLAPLIEARLPLPARFDLYPLPLIEAACYGVLTALIFTLWPLARVEQVRPAALYRSGAAHGGRVRARYVILTAALIAGLVALASWFSGTLRLTLWTTGGIVIALILLSLAALATSWLARRVSRRLRAWPTLRWAGGAIGAAPGETRSVMLALGLGLSVLAVVGQIDGNLRQAISGTLPDVAPSYFFVDIQKDQMPAFQARLDQDPGVSRVQSAPMLRGIITRINSRPAEEVAPGHWVIEGDRGVTYSATPPEGTRLTAGSWWAPDYTGAPQVSFAAEEAEEMGLKLGDQISVNILGREIDATITSFREVDFSTAGIGFILSMNPSALQGAPHSFIATVYATPEAEAPILRDLARAHPNITAIRVRDAIDRVAGMLGAIANATRWGAAATLLTGFMVLIAAVAAGERARSFEAAVLRTLGAPRGRVLASFALRQGIMGLVAGLVALMAGIAGGWAVMRFVMETGFSVQWGSAIFVVGAGVLATVLAGLVFAWRPMSTSPASVLRHSE